MGSILIMVPIDVPIQKYVKGPQSCNQVNFGVHGFGQGFRVLGLRASGLESVALSSFWFRSAPLREQG